VKKGKITDLEKLIAELKKQLEDEMKKQKMSADALLEDLVSMLSCRKNSRRERSGNWKRS
jgi:hypothetical protein